MSKIIKTHTVKNDVRGRTIAICTPVTNWFGIWYLSQSLYKELILNNKVFFIPREKYDPEIGITEKPVFDIVSPEIAFDKEKLQEFIRNNNIDTFILVENYSFDFAEWLKSIGCTIIDVPMVEIVKPKIFNSGIYKMYDEIWCVTDYTYETFAAGGYANVRRIDWDFANFEYFHPSKKEIHNDLFTFYHPASPGVFDKRATYQVLKAFEIVSRKIDTRLIISCTSTPTHYSWMADRWMKSYLSKNIPKNLDLRLGVHTREQLADLYRSCDIVLCPDKRAGLGLMFFEARKCGKKAITVDAPPMNEQGEFLCSVKRKKFTKKSMIPLYEVDIKSLADTMLKVAKNRS